MTSTAGEREEGERGGHGRVVLHRLSLDDGKRELLARAGIDVVRARSVRAVCEAIDGAKGKAFVLVDLAIGSNAPEKIWAHVAERCAETPDSAVFIACSSTRSAGSTRRAAKLGLRQVFVWPEGAFGQLMRRLAMLPNVTLHRLAERAAVNDEISGQSGLQFEGELVNISACGAMIECGLEHEELEGLTFEINVFEQAAELNARVRWRERFTGPTGAERIRMGVEFVAVSAPARAAITRFVRDTNVMRVRPATTKRSEASPGQIRVRARHGTRVDFFLLRGDLQAGALLVPRRAFFVPYDVGDILSLDILSPRVMGAVEVQIVERESLDEGRVDGRIGWRVRVCEERAPSAAPDRSAADLTPA